MSPHDQLNNVFPHLFSGDLLKDGSANLYMTSAVLATAFVAAVWIKRLRGPRSQDMDMKVKAEGKEVLDAKARLAAAVIPPPGQVKVSKILVHPIKSCKGLSVQSANYTPEGLEYDRIWSIIDASTRRIITAREVPKMVLISSKIEKDERVPYKGLLRVTVPRENGPGAVFCVPLEPTGDILDSWENLPEITIWPTHPPVDGYICEAVSDKSDGLSPSDTLSEYFGKPVHLVYKGTRPRQVDATIAYPNLQATSKYQDMYPLLILSEESMPEIEGQVRRYVGSQGVKEEWTSGRVVIERFRPNIILKGGGPFAEDVWDEITIGAEDAPGLSLVSRCTRCLLPNVSPDTGERDAAVPYKVIMKFRTGLDPEKKLKPCVGCNAVPAASGRVQVGDWVYVKKLATL